jgi:hypothetical protein
MFRTPVRTVAVAAAAMLALLAPATAASAFTVPPRLLPVVAGADGPVTWSVEPMPTSEGGRRFFDYAVDPGTQVQDAFLITNGGDTEAEFTIYATDAFNDPATGNFSLLDQQTAPTDLGAWITPANDKLTIGPGLQATVPFDLLIPSDATPGDHSAGIVASVLTEATQDGSTVLLEQRVGVRMYLTVSGEPSASVEVEDLTSSFIPSLNPFAPGELVIDYEVRNTGNKRVDVNQRLRATGIFGIPIGEDDPPAIGNLLPRQTVHVQVRLSGVAALLFALSNVTLEPGAVGSAQPTDGATSTAPTATPTPTETPTPEATADAGGPIDPDQTEIDYETVSAEVGTPAITWTLLALLVLVIAAIYLGWRYVTGTRERMYAAIDEAAAAAREDERANRGDADSR